MRSALIALWSTLLFPLPGTASTSDDEAVFPQQMNAKKLMTYCASSALTTRGRTQRGYCDGFVSGIEEVIRLYKVTFTAESNVAVCVPAGTSSRTLSQAFIQHATSKGVDLDQPAAAVVLEALQHRFSC